MRDAPGVLRELNALLKRTAAEGIGTAFLLAAIVGSGIMAAQLAPGNPALALLINSIATGAALSALIIAIGPLSGAHLNPLVTLVVASRRALAWRDVPPYIAAQFAGAIAGVALANVMFAAPMVSFSHHERTGGGLWLGESLATFGLVAIVVCCMHYRSGLSSLAVGAYIASAIWFTSSTSFANPAVTLGRSLSDSFAGIAPSSVAGFVLAQCVGALAAMAAFGWLVPGVETT